MKLIIYAGISLFSVASVYGVADYYQTEKSGTLKNLYKETSASVKEEERVIDAEDYSRGKINEPVLASNEEVPVIKKTTPVKVPMKKKTTAIKKRTAPSKLFNAERKINLEKFSRAKLDVKIDTLPSFEASLYEQ